MFQDFVLPTQLLVLNACNLISLLGQLHYHASRISSLRLWRPREYLSIFRSVPCLSLTTPIALCMDGKEPRRLYRFVLGSFLPSLSSYNQAFSLKSPEIAHNGMSRGDSRYRDVPLIYPSIRQSLAWLFARCETDRLLGQRCTDVQELSLLRRAYESFDTNERPW
jgi:hypothetical protein